LEISLFIHSFISLLPTDVKTHSPLHMTKTYYDHAVTIALFLKRTECFGLS